MSLLTEAMTNCILMDRRTVPDGFGGYKTIWSEGAEISAAIVKDTSMQAKVAEAQGVKSLYTITTVKALNLQFHDVFKRTSDGRFFRVTSNGDDKATPASATIDMRQVSAEELEELPT